MTSFFFCVVVCLGLRVVRALFRYIWFGRTISNLNDLGHVIVKGDRSLYSRGISLATTTPLTITTFHQWQRTAALTVEALARPDPVRDRHIADGLIIGRVRRELDPEAYAVPSVSASNSTMATSRYAGPELIYDRTAPIIPAIMERESTKHDKIGTNDQKVFEVLHSPYVT
jgi:hypothetical protein